MVKNQERKKDKNQAKDLHFKCKLQEKFACNCESTDLLYF